MSIKKRYILNKINILIIENNFNRSLNNVIPQGITHLIFGIEFNKKRRYTKSVTHLILGGEFNKIIDQVTIPHGVIHLTFGNEFKMTIFNNVIPNSVTHLSFGEKFHMLLLNTNIPKKEQII